MSDSEKKRSFTKFKHKGVDYLKSGDGFLYDPKTNKNVGWWDAETKEIAEDAFRVTKFKHKGVDYLKSDVGSSDGGGNFLYDPETSESVGYWNEETKEIEFAPEFGSDEESEDSDDGADDNLEPELRAVLEAREEEEKEELLAEKEEPIKRTEAQINADEKFADDMIAQWLAEANTPPGRGKSTQPSVSKPPLPPILTPEPAPPNTSSEAAVEKKKRCPKGTRRNKKTGDCESKTASQVTPGLQARAAAIGTSQEVRPPIQKKEKKQAKSFRPDQLLSFADFQAKLNLGK